MKPYMEKWHYQEKTQGTNFNVEVTDEDRKIALKEGYKVVAARLCEESASLAQESSAPNDISQVNWSDGK